MKTWEIIVTVVVIVAVIGLSLGLGLGLGLSSSSTNNSDTGGIIFSFINGTSSSGSVTPTDPGDTFDPTVLGLKIVSIKIVEDLDDDNNIIGNSAIIWLNESCQNNSNCGITSSFQKQVDSFIDFALPTEELNTEFNFSDSNIVQVPVGTYKYILFDFCGPDSVGIDNTTSNVEFSASGMTEPYSYASELCRTTASILNSSDTVTQNITEINVVKNGNWSLSCTISNSDKLIYYPDFPAPQCASNGFCVLGAPISIGECVATRLTQ